jgi:hypothetical protein
MRSPFAAHRSEAPMAFEYAACLDASVAKGFASIDRVRPGKKCLRMSQRCY